MPELGPAHHRLAAFEGAWEGSERLQASPWSPGGSATARLEFRVLAGGFAVAHDYESSAGLTAHGVFSASGDDVLWHWFDSIGHPPEVPARGRWDGDTLTLTRASPRGTNTTTWALDGDALTQRIEFNGELLAEATYVRSS
jgi:hypothetical protein